MSNGKDMIIYLTHGLIIGLIWLIYNWILDLLNTFLRHIKHLEETMLK